MQTDDLIGEVLDRRYRIERKLGEGGMGMVYLGKHVRTGRKCAVKLLPVEAADDVEAVHRFEREARVLGALGHPGIVGVHDFSETPDGRPFFVMDNLEGEDLSSRLKRVGRLGWNHTQGIVDEIAAALWAAHQAGVLHRDLKPANVFLARSAAAPERVVLLDFGLAKGGVEDSVSITHSNMVMGTPLYMSPEQARSAGVDARSDIYSLAAMTFELLAGQPPFVGPNYTAVLAKLLTEPPPRLSDRATTPVPEHLDEVLAVALSKDPVDRHPDVAAFATAVLQRRPDWVHAQAVSLPRASPLPTAVANADAPLAATVASNPTGTALAKTVDSSPPDLAATKASSPTGTALAGTVASSPPVLAITEASGPSVGAAEESWTDPPRAKPVLPRLILGLLLLGVVGIAVAYGVGWLRGDGSSGGGAGQRTDPADAPQSALSQTDASTQPDSGTRLDVGVGAVTPEPRVAALSTDGGARPKKVVRRRHLQPPKRPSMQRAPMDHLAAMGRAGAVPPPMGRARVAVPSRPPPGAPMQTQATKDVLRLVPYSARRDFKGCVRAASRMKPSKLVLKTAVGCAFATQNRGDILKTCRRFLRHFPRGSYSKHCRTIIKRYTAARKRSMGRNR